jgi:hypothetical protein
MKSGTPILLIVILLICGVTSCDDEEKTQPIDEGSTACGQAIEQLQDALFPRDSWLETQAWIVSIFNIVGIKLDETEKNVTNYEVGRAMAAQLAISQAGNSSACQE